jgi:hypothetical protein
MDIKKFVNKEFWSKKEISYQYVHFTNAAVVSYILAWFTHGYIATMFAGFLVGCIVEINQWIHGNHKIEDSIRDLCFWLLGSIVGYYLLF